jgi:hypothetical protein
MELCRLSLLLRAINLPEEKKTSKPIKSFRVFREVKYPANIIGKEK